MFTIRKEVIIRLHIGTTYIGDICNFSWTPSFNMFKHQPLRTVDKYMKIPADPIDLKLKYKES